MGIDINELNIGEKKSKGAVVFKTWDFSGQVQYLFWNHILQFLAHMVKGQSELLAILGVPPSVVFHI